MTDQLATLTSEGDVSIITLNDGKANVFSPEMSKTISSLLDEVPDDKGSLVITGRPGIFSAIHERWDHLFAYYQYMSSHFKILHRRAPLPFLRHAFMPMILTQFP